MLRQFDKQEPLEEFMDVEKAFILVVDALQSLLDVYPLYMDTIDKLDGAKNIDKKCINIPPVKLAHMLMATDENLPMPDAVFSFVEKAFRDAYYQLGNYKCPFLLGRMYSEERFGHIDYQKAAEWFERGRIVISGESEAKLGRCYYYGLGVPQDYKKAYHLMVKWAMSHNDNAAEAMFLVGDMYYYGQYVDEDRVQAIEMYRKAEAIYGEDSYWGNASEIYLRIADYHMNEVADEIGYREALKYYQKAEYAAYNERSLWYMDYSSLLQRAENGQSEARRLLKSVCEKEDAEKAEKIRSAELFEA